MRTRLLLALALALAAPLVLAVQPPPASADKPATASHPLSGIVVEVRRERSALLVKHEEIPGVMRAMTMLLKVDGPVLDQVKAGDTIKAKLSRRDDAWWLHAVTVVPPKSGGAAK